jgi:predicted GNAT family acetyltransferase
LETRFEHDSAHTRFVVDVGLPGQPATLNYRQADEQTVDFFSTLVPPQMRGQGLGTRLVREALDWARAEGYQVIPTCPFVGDIIERFPEYEEVVAQAGASVPSQGQGKVPLD